MQNQPLPLGSRILVALLCAGIFWLWFSFIRFRPDDLQDYSTVTGTLVSAQEEISSGASKSGNLDIRLKESTVRYCVPADGYLDYFRREAFFAEVRKGATIQLTALKSEIASPQTFLLNSTPTVFVRGVRVGERDYCVVQDHIAWQKRNNWWKLGVAVAGSGLLAWLFVGPRTRSEAEGGH